MCRQHLHEDGKASTKIGAGLEAVPLQNMWFFLSLALSPQHFYLFQSAFLTAEAVLIFAFCSTKHDVSPEVIIINQGCQESPTCINWDVHPFLMRNYQMLYGTKKILKMSALILMLLDYKVGYCCGAENTCVCQTTTVLAISNNRQQYYCCH